MENKIIYALWVMEKLVKLGYYPVKTLPNPKDTRFNCWVFESTEKFEKDLTRILKGGSNNG
jgi:hypothetical protein